MNTVEKKFIIIILIVIIILALMLIFIVKNSEKPNEELYEDIYSEYKEIFKNANIDENKEKTTNEVEESAISEEKTSNTEKNNRIIGEITIPKIDLVYPIIYKTTDEYLKIAPTKLEGPNINTVGNFCIVSHNFRYSNENLFSRLHELEIGDKVFLSSNSKKEMCYVVYKKYEVNENDISCLNQETDGKIETTLITCTNKSKDRLIVKCREE